MATKTKELTLLKNIIKTYHKHTDAENEYRRNPSDKSFDDYQKTELKFMLSIQIAEEYIREIENNEIKR